jgi:integrase
VVPNNPAGDPTVKQYLLDLIHEQAQAGIAPSPAIPMFQEKLIMICAAADVLLAGSSLTAAQRYCLLRDIAAICLDAASGQRGGDLTTLRTEGVLRFPGGDGLLFGFTWGKTLRSGSRHIFGVRARTDLLLICPVRRLQAFRTLAATYGPAATAPGSYVFHPWRSDGPAFFKQLSSGSLNRSLQAQLKRLDAFDGETFHGLRAAFAISAAIQGMPLRDIMAVAQWKDPAMAHRYMRLHHVMSMAPADVPVDTKLYTELNKLRKFVTAFPATYTRRP